MRPRLIIVDPKKLTFAKYNPSSRTERRKMIALIKSVREFGVLQPIMVTEKLEVIDGHRRAMASIENGLNAIPAYQYRNGVDPRRIYTEVNSTGRPFSPGEETQAYANGGPVAPKAFSHLKEIERFGGKTAIARMATSSTSHNVLGMINRIALYCKRDHDDFKTSVLFWLMEHKQTYTIRRAIEDGVSPEFIAEKIVVNQPLQIRKNYI